ncbi:acetyltransferase, partial [Lactobacillus paragasseri]|nr:acetyltransferase [Lactobacillus paragasseri]
GAVASFVWMVSLYDPKVDPTRVYYGTDTHAFGLLFGAALALWLTSTSSRAEADSWPRTEPLLRDFFGSSAQAFVVASLPLIFLSLV